MEEKVIFFPISPTEFLDKIRTMIEEIVDEKVNPGASIPPDLAEKTLLLPKEVCRILRVSKPTLYTWIKQGRIKSFKIKTRRYFARTDVERICKSGFGLEILQRNS